MSNPLCYAQHLYIGEEEIKDLVIPNSMTSIGDRTFYNCSGLTSVTIPNSVTNIGGTAFYGCSGLTSVTIGNSVTSMGNNVFLDCSGLNAVHISDIASWCKISFSNGYSNPLFYAHHLYLGEEEIKDLVIPTSVTSIGSSAFSDCSGLTSVTIPNSVTTIGNAAFLGCSGLTSVAIGNSVSSIGNQAFYGCSSLNSVTIGNNVLSIGNWAFQGCSSLTSITIPNSVKGIGQEAFRGCSGLTSVTIGSGVKTIDSQAFAYCKELTDVYCLAENVPSTSTDAFNESLIEYATLHVPTSSIDAYRAKEPWKSFKEIKSLTGEDVPVTPDPEKCATPTIAFVDGKLKFNCETEDVEFVYDIKSTYSVHGVGSEVEPVCKCTVTVYATRQDYYNSDVATLEFTLGADGDVCDTNKDGVVDVADIATIIDKMAGK